MLGSTEHGWSLVNYLIFYERNSKDIILAVKCDALTEYDPDPIEAVCTENQQKHIIIVSGVWDIH